MRAGMLTTACAARPMNCPVRAKAEPTVPVWYSWAAVMPRKPAVVVPVGLPWSSKVATTLAMIGTCTVVSTPLRR